MKILNVWMILFLLAVNQVNAQEPTQVLRGNVTDQILKQPVFNASITIVELNRSVVSDDNGYFRFNDVPVGTYRLLVTHAAYEDRMIDGIIINAGKETVLQADVITKVRTETAVLVKAKSRRNLPLNDMSLVSARAFTVEETQKYAASVNDPLRMAMAFPGVMAVDDGNNRIIIRGNSPSGLLWRMEGMDIPNPNHFGNAGSSGGGISILSSQLLANSDFVTGAFAAEYGNALSGVFDLKLRKGNNEKNEYAVQAGVLGLNVAAEGPFSKNYSGSFLVNYRYSTLNLLSKIGVIPGEGSTDFQDLSYHLYLPTKGAGTFSIFGFGGLSSDDMPAEKDSLKWESKSDRYQSDFIANTLFNGINHSIRLGAKARLQSGIGYSVVKNAYEEFLVDDDYELQETLRVKYYTRKLNLSSTLHYRFNNQLHARAGVIVTRHGYNYYQETPDNEGDPLELRIDERGHTYTQQFFAQAQYRLTDRWTLNAGANVLRLSLNEEVAIDPRASLQWQVDSKNSLAFAYGLHSQIQPLGVYFAKDADNNGNEYYLNKDLDFSRAHHFVLSYNRKLTEAWKLKTELYYQDLFQVPVSTKAGSTFSMLNNLEDFPNDPMVNEGKGKNYGVEISAERYLRNQFYFLLSQSLYQSKYTALDGVERNTRFNGNYITTIVTGRDFESSKKNKIFGVNLKMILAGGQRTTPIDEESSREKGYTVWDEANAYTLKNPAYFRTDLRLSIKWNRRKHTSTLSLDIQNLTNRLNVFNQWYDSEKGGLQTNYQAGLIPVLNWKLDF